MIYAKPREVREVLVCPVCGERGIGKVGIGQYYCKDCCIEFEYKNDKIKIYSVQDDGTLLAIPDESTLDHLKPAQ